MPWSPSLYSQFEDQRNRPIQDLLAQVSIEPEEVVDLGCGPGNSTEFLSQRFPHAKMIGIDSSPEMIEAARKRLSSITFELADIATWKSDQHYDLLFANASLQWLPDHEHLFPQLLSMLRPNGVLAIQIPDNLFEPSHALMRETAESGPWVNKLTKQPRDPSSRHSPQWYFELLSRHARQVNIWRTTYYHLLQGGPSAIVTMFRSTGLRPFLDPLDEAEKKEFLSVYEKRISAAYPSNEQGAVILPFPRLFLVARK